MDTCVHLLCLSFRLPCFTDHVWIFVRLHNESHKHDRHSNHNVGCPRLCIEGYQWVVTASYYVSGVFDRARRIRILKIGRLALSMLKGSTPTRYTHLRALSLINVNRSWWSDPLYDSCCQQAGDGSVLVGATDSWRARHTATAPQQSVQGLLRLVANAQSEQGR